MIEKFKALLQWFVLLERKEHRHWCFIRNPQECEHAYSCWMCKGSFCANIERKDCPKCKKSDKQTISAYNKYIKVNTEIRN